MKNIFTFLSFFGILTIANAQSWGDYTLIARQNSTSASLINLNKTAIKTWSLTGSTGYSAYLLPGGDLLRSVMNTGNSFSGGGITGRIQKVNYAGTILWDYVYSTSTYCMHHDICPMPNGNVLIISYESKTASEVAAAGGTFGSTVWSEKIVELQPNGTSGANVVWEWHLWDHLAQNVDPAKPNYVTSIVNNPQLMNINYNTQKDWVHMNGIDYNSSTDQIVVSSHNLNEMWLIDHSTSTAQAASHSGGNSGKGGDFLYRWGNPAAYGAAGSTIFNVVHDAHWVHDGPYAGYFSAFNNRGVSNNQSCVDYILPNYTLTPGQAYLPATYSARLPINTYTSNMGNSQQLPNGNTLVCVATAGNILEFNSAGTVIWNYNTGGTTPQARRYEASYLCASPPTTSASASAGSVCANTPITLNANASGSSLTYAWSSSPAGFTSTSATPSVTPTTTTTYTVTVTSGICTSTSSTMVTVNTKPTVTITPSPTASVCSGSSVTLTANPTGGSGFTYAWSGAGLNATIQNPNFVPSSTGAYTVTVTNSAACTGTATQTVTVNTLPSTNPTALSTNLCQGTSTTLNANASGGSAYTYAWSSNPASSIASSATPSISPIANTTYTVTVTSNGCTTTGTVNVNVNPLPTANAGADISINLGDNATLTASGGTSYAWNNGVNSASNVVSPSNTTTYTVTVTDINGCTAVDQVIVTVVTLTATATASQTSVCSGATVQLGVNTTGGNGTNTYTWSSLSGFSSMLQNPNVSPTETTTYTVTVTSGALTSTSFVTVSVKSIPNLNASADQTTVCSGTFIQLSATVSGTLSNTFSWATPSGVFSSTQNPIVSPNASTTYTVTVTSNGCSSTSSVSIVVNQKPIANAGGDIIINKGESTTLTASGGGTYLWSNGVNAAANTVSPVSTTTYSVTVTSANGCTATDDVIVTVNSLAAFAGATQTTICAGKTTELNFSVTGALSTISALWKDESGSFTSSQENPTVNPTVTTTYTVTVTSGTQSTQASVTIFVNPKPIVTISASQDFICNGETVQLNSTVTGTSSNTYKWSSTNGFSATVSNPSHVPTVTTNYVLTVTSASGCTAIAVTTVTVKPTPTATINATQNTICAGTTTTLDAIASGAANYIYTWASAPNGFSASVKNPSVSPTITTTYLLTVSSDGCTTTTSKSITVNPIPQVNLGNDLTINLGETTTITATGGTSYLWSNSATTASIIVKPDLTSTYYVTVSNANGCTASDNINVNVLGGILTVATTPNIGKVCKGDSLQLTALVSGGIGTNTFSWTSTPAGFSSSLQNPMVTPTENTVYTLTVTSGLQTTTSSVTVTVNALPLANAGSDIAIVKGQTASLTANGGQSYFWSNGANTQSVTVLPTATTIYMVTVTDENGCTATDDVTVSVSTLSVTITANIPLKLCAGTAVQLNSIVGGGIGATTYQWASNPSGFSSTLKNPSVSPTSSTTYFLTVTNSGIEATSSVLIDVLPLPATPSITQKGDTLISSTLIGNHWFFNGSATQDTTTFIIAKTSGAYQVQIINENGCKSALSSNYNFVKSNIFDAIQASEMKVFPNPTTGTLTLQGDFLKEEIFEVFVYNNQGQVLKRIKNTNVLDLSTFDSQVLYIILKSPSYGTYMSRVILEK